ncbi:MAG: Nif3-like dinuclear metal center hexameric protein [Chitinivibrionales bacterium]
MMQRDELVRFLDQFLCTAEIKDSSWNGLQFEGAAEVHRILFAVDAGIETFEAAKKHDAQMVIVHHGLFWRPVNPSLSTWNKQRIKFLYDADISLYACHLPLDRHPEVGNNAQLLKLLGAEIREEFMFVDGKSVSFIGEYAQPISVDTFTDRVKQKINPDSKIYRFGKDEICRIAVLSGGGGYAECQAAIDMGMDAFLTGDTSELYHLGRDAGIHLVFSGHHATERPGIQALQKTVKSRCGVETVFVDIDTGL